MTRLVPLTKIFMIVAVSLAVLFPLGIDDDALAGSDGRGRDAVAHPV